MKIHFFTAPFYFAFIWFRVSPWGGAPFDCLRKRFSRFHRFKGGAAHFVILSGRKTSYVRKWMI